MRLAAALAAALLGGSAALHAQTPAACIPGDQDLIRQVCLGAPDPAAPYGHSVLGDTPECTALTVDLGPNGPSPDAGPQQATIPAGSGHIFEDIVPRLADINGDGRQEIVVVQSAFDKGARLVVYAVAPKPRLLAATPYIGQPNRWLAPAGIADFDGDGRVEIAYVDRPHLLGDLVFVRQKGDRLVETARLSGFSNHRIGDAFISGGVRDCGQGAELILASKDWTRLLRVRNGQVTDLGPLPAAGLTIPPC